MERILLIACSLFGGFWAYKGWFEYGLWVNKGPGGGFFPVVIGLLMLSLSIFILFKNDIKAVAIEKKALVPVLATIVALVSINILGLITTVGLFVILWLIVFEKFRFLKAGIIGLSTTLVIYVAFKVWLQVPFPIGLLGF